MRTNVPFESWQLALPRRVATLARMEPLHRFELGKAARNQNLDEHDLRTLALMVFDAVIERMGLAPGASQNEVIEALRPLIEAAEPQADSDRILEIATTVMDFLLNEAERRRAFSETVRYFEGTKQVCRDISFHYLQQVIGPNDEPLFRATVEGINLYTGTLGLDVEDAHAANAAVLKYQIGRGRFREAVATARQAVAISTAYEQQVKRAIETARRDVTQVDWAGEILAALSDAREHLRVRIDQDNEILEAVESHANESTLDEQGHVDELVKHIRVCQSRHATLHVLVIDANESWLSEHSRQAFRPRALGTLPDLELSVLRSSLSLFESQFENETAWQLTGVFLPPWPPVVVDGRRLLEYLLSPVREQDTTPVPDEPDAEELLHAPERFRENDYRDADRLLSEISEQGELLSSVLEKARSAGAGESTQTLLYLLALRDYGEVTENAEFVVESAGHSFFAEPFWGDDLLILQPEQSAEEEK